MGSSKTSPYTLSWGVMGPVRVLILTGANGELPEDLLEMARSAFQSPLNFEVRVKLHPIRYNPSGRLLARLREELRHWWHLDRPWWVQVGVAGGGRMPAHWRLVPGHGWRDVSYKIQLEWADVVVMNSTSLWREVKGPLIHVIQSERRWNYNPAGSKAVSVGDPLVLRYQAYRLGRVKASKRLLRWDRSDPSTLVLKEYGGI